MTLVEFLAGHGGVLILPLAVIEGPVVSVVTGFLTAQGYFSWYWALPLLIGGDLIGDVIYYWTGRSGRMPLAGIGRRLGLHRVVSPALRSDLRTNSAKMLVIGKWTHSIGALVLIGSGMLKVPLPGFVAINLLATIPKSALLFCFGYFAGDGNGVFERHAVLGSLGLLAAGMLIVAFVLRRPRILRVSRPGR